MKGLGIGRVVHVVLDNRKHRPAIVVDIINEDTGLIEAKPFYSDTDDVGGENLISIHSDTPMPGTWHWPEYIP